VGTKVPMTHEGNASEKPRMGDAVGMKVPLVHEGLVVSIFYRYTDFH
jgi:hypothetical protein